MGIRQSIEWGKNHLRTISQKLFSPAAPTAFARTENKEHVFSFPTGTHREPLELHIKLFPLDEWGPQASRLILDTKNARHPYDKEHQFGYFGIEIMNPALLTALTHIESIYARLEKNIWQATKAMNPKSTIRPHMSGIEAWFTFNTDDNEYLKAAPSQISAFYEQAIALIEEERPLIQKHIDQSVVLQPDPNPDAETRFAFDTMISEAIVRGLKGMPGHDPHTVYVLKDGTRKGLLKGPE